MTDSSRRHYLAASAAVTLAGLSGCNTNLLGGSRTVDIHDTHSKNGTTVRLDGVTVRDSFLYTNPSGFWIPANESFGERYVFASVTVKGKTPPNPSNFELLTGDGTTVAYGSANPGPVRPEDDIRGVSQPYEPDNGVFSGPVIFAFNFFETEPDELYIAWGGKRWRLESAHRARVAYPRASFDFAAFDPPETHSRGSPLRVEFDVQNTSDEDGTFWGALHLVSPRGPFVSVTESARAIQIEMDAGERRRWGAQFGTEFLADVSNLRFVLHSLAGEREFEVAITD